MFALVFVGIEWALVYMIIGKQNLFIQTVFLACCDYLEIVGVNIS